VYTYIQTYIHTYIHTHTHTHIYIYIYSVCKYTYILWAYVLNTHTNASVDLTLCNTNFYIQFDVNN